MAVKKEMKPIQIFEDLVVKLKNIYKEMYFFRYSFCVPGEDIPDSVVGDILCELEPQYKECVKALFDGIECIHIPSIGTLREVIKTYLENGESDLSNEAVREYLFSSEAVEKVTEKTEDSLKFVTRFEEFFNDSKRVWSCIGDNESLIETIYDKKGIFNFPIGKNGEEYVTIAKSMIPIITEKTVSNAFINVQESKEYEGLYEVLIDFKFTHFRMECVYTNIPLPFE